jgi:outer membrane lipopolysaccharide assembly protein LptE/RlpB
MMKPTLLTTVFAAAAVLALSACGNERTAEADTSVAEAEVSTDMPEGAVSDAQLEAAANRAAADASQPQDGALTPDGQPQTPQTAPAQ